MIFEISDNVVECKNFYKPPDQNRYFLQKIYKLRLEKDIKEKI